MPSDLEWIVLATPDLNHSLRGKALSAKEFATATESGSSITDLILAVDGLDDPILTTVDAGPKAGSKDLVLWPDPRTLTPLPWRPNWGWCLSSPSWPDGSPCELSPRVVCETVVDRLASAGLQTLAAFEYEFRLYDEVTGAPVTPGRSYSLNDLRGLAPFLDSLRQATDACGIVLSALHTEAGPGLVEANMAPSAGIQAADQAALLRACITEIAHLHGMRASFLAKPEVDEEGSGGHLHVSVAADGRNLFAGDLRGGEDPSPELRHAVAGMLARMAPLSVIFNPAINSYKRLVPGWFAPVSASWAVDNRAAAVRVVAGADPNSTHIELRRAGADANPHLVFAAAAASILLGLEHGDEPPEPLSPGDATGTSSGGPLPSDLGAALLAFEADLELRSCLGERFCAHFEATRTWELEAWQKVVSDWERERVEGRSCPVWRPGSSGERDQDRREIV
jgi:glutamine synthetase